MPEVSFANDNLSIDAPSPGHYRQSRHHYKLNDAASGPET
jgi:hypothetical protein